MLVELGALNLPAVLCHLCLTAHPLFEVFHIEFPFMLGLAHTSILLSDPPVYSFLVAQMTGMSHYTPLRDGNSDFLPGLTLDHHAPGAAF
jgi:hypothetical protein